MNKTYFAFSDVHGFFNEMITALNEAGFDYDNPSHIAVFLGDWSDRGPDCVKVYLWLREMQEKNKCIVLQGNHDEFFSEFLKGPVTMYNYRYNGLGTTLDDFYHQTASFRTYLAITEFPKEYTVEQAWEDWSEIVRNSINEEYPELLSWIENLLPYYETKNHIFTHGSIQPYMNWKQPEQSWNWHHWDKGHFINEKILNTDKTIVLGHFDGGSLRKKHGLGREDDYSILKSPDGQKLFIDACTVISGKVNVLVLEDEEIAKNC